MGSMSVSSFMCVSCVYPATVPNATFCITCSLSMLVEDARGDHREAAYTRGGLMTAIYVGMSVSLCLPHAVVVNVFSMCR